jgi:hypothetical protein
MFNSNSIKFRSASGGTRLVSSTLIRILAVVMAFLVIVDATQAGILISGQDHRDLGDVNSLKAFNTQTGGLLWQVAAGNAKAGEIDQITGDLVVASGGASLGVTDDVRRYDVQTGAVIGNNPLYNHGIGNAPGIAIDPINGDIYHTAASSPPGHNGLRLFASNGGNQADFLGGG